MSDVLLFSGGMDSVAAWHLLGRPARAYVCIGAPYETREVESLMDRGLYDGVRVLDGGAWLGSLADGAGRVPLRNLFFAVTAAAATGADRVILGATAGETSPDKSRAFARAASAAMTAAEGRPVRLALPFRGITKRQLAGRLLAALGRTAGEAALRASPSCYVARPAAGAVGCGRCTSCLRRWVAMSLNGITESYEVAPWEAHQARQWLQAAAGIRLRTYWPYLRRTPLRDWPGVARLNAELLLALRRQRHEGVQ